MPSPPPRQMRVECLTTNLSAVMRDLAEQIAAGADDGERYAVEIVVVGPLTVEEAVTALWSRVRQTQIPVT